MNGPRSNCSSLRISISAITNSVNETPDLSTEPIVAARWLRRSDSSPVDSRNELFSTRSLNGRRMRGTSPTLTGFTARSMMRWMIARSTSVTTMIARMRAGISISHLLWSSRNFGSLAR